MQLGAQPTYLEEATSQEMDDHPSRREEGSQAEGWQCCTAQRFDVDQPGQEVAPLRQDGEEPAAIRDPGLPEIPRPGQHSKAQQPQESGTGAVPLFAGQTRALARLWLILDYWQGTGG